MTFGATLRFFALVTLVLRSYGLPWLCLAADVADRLGARPIPPIRGLPRCAIVAAATADELDLPRAVRRGVPLVGAGVKGREVGGVEADPAPGA